MKFNRLVLAGAAMLVTTAAQAAPLDLSTFTVNGSASVANNRITLTPDAQAQAGSAYAGSQVSTSQNFIVSFDFVANTSNDGIADGFSFILQSAGANALGLDGGGLGAMGILPSAGVAFRSYMYNSAGIFQNGNIFTMDNSQAFNFGLNNSGHVSVDYDAASNLLSYDAINTATDAHANGSQTINLASLLGPTAYFGFTGGTGGLSSNQSISNVTTSVAGAVPEPATWAMMILGMGAVGFAMRSAKRRSDEKFDAKIKKITYGAIA